MWPLVKLSDVLFKSEDWIQFDPQKDYKEVTVRLWGRGVTLRRIVTGSELIGAKRLQVCSDQFIVSRIDARNGAFGLIPEELDGAVVSNDFPVFHVDKSRLLPNYIGWLSKTRDFVESCKAVSEGTTNRVRLKENKFLQLEIPLPPLSEQRWIVEKIKNLNNKIQEAKKIRESSSKSTISLIDTAFNKLIENKKLEWLSVDETAEINPRRNDIALNDSQMVSFVPMSAINADTGRIDNLQDKLLAEVKKGYTFFMEGDVLFARITPCMQNGKSVVAKNLTNGIGFGTTEFHVLRPKSKITKEWLHKVIRSKWFRDDAEAHFKGTAGQQRVPANFIRKKKIPVPSLIEQCRIVTYLDSLQSKIYCLKDIQSQTQKELDALLPSILDKAFKGKL